MKIAFAAVGLSMASLAAANALCEVLHAPTCPFTYCMMNAILVRS